MYLGNVLLLIFNIPMIAVWVKILKIPYYALYPLILLFCVVGTYTINNNPFEIYILIIFGGIGYVFRKTGFDLASFVIALVLGPMLEENFRHALVLSEGNFSVFFTRPISLIFLLISIFLLSTLTIPFFRKKSQGFVIMLRLTWTSSFMASFTILAVSSIISKSSMP